MQFGSANYCSRKQLALAYNSDMMDDIIESPDAEIAIWCEEAPADLSWFRFDNYDTVLGYVTPNDVAKWITIAASTEGFESVARKAIAAGLQQTSTYVSEQLSH